MYFMKGVEQIECVAFMSIGGASPAILSAWKNRSGEDGQRNKPEVNVYQDGETPKI
jgi:hypothetical protein